MRTWLWYDGPQAADVPADVGGWSVTTSLRPVEYRWVTGDGASYTSTRPGTEAQPAATHVYIDDDDYTVTLEVTWAGSYTVAEPGRVTDTIPLGPVVVSSDRPYEVIELQAVRRR